MIGAQVFGHPADNKGGPVPLTDPPTHTPPKEGNVKRTTIVAAVMVAAIAAPSAASASPANALQPANVYFGKVVSGDHPKATVTLKNVTGHQQYLRRFDLAGAGGRKFTLTWKHATCYAGKLLKAGQTCTLTVRVATERPEFWQTTLSVYYGRPLHFHRGTRGQFNGSVYAHIVPA